MKSQPHRNPDAHRSAGSTSPENHSVRERGMHAAHARPPPAVPYRRYPSLSGDGQPCFPHLQRTRGTADADVTMIEPSPLFSVRAFALLAIVAIVATLVASV